MSNSERNALRWWFWKYIFQKPVYGYTNLVHIACGVLGLVRQSAGVERKRLRRPGRCGYETGEDMASGAGADERVRVYTDSANLPAT